MRPEDIAAEFGVLPRLNDSDGDSKIDYWMASKEAVIVVYVLPFDASELKFKQM